MRRQLVLLLTLTLLGCARLGKSTRGVQGADVPFPPTWTPTVAVESTSTATLVVQPTPTWDGTPPPPSEAEVPRVLPGKLYRDVGSGAYEVVDLRNYAAYKQAHIDGAVHIPFEELPDRVGELDGNKIIAFYDLAPSESTSLVAAMMLYDLGFTQVVVLDGGLSKWYTDGYPIQGTLLTPTPEPAGPPWTVTPLATSTALPTAALTPTSVSATSTITPTATMAQ